MAPNDSLNLSGLLSPLVKQGVRLVNCLALKILPKADEGKALRSMSYGLPGSEAPGGSPAAPGETAHLCILSPKARAQGGPGTNNSEAWKSLVHNPPSPSFPASTL